MEDKLIKIWYIYTLTLVTVSVIWALHLVYNATVSSYNPPGILDTILVILWGMWFLVLLLASIVVAAWGAFLLVQEFLGDDE